MKAVIFARGYDLHGQVQAGRKYADKMGYTVEGVIVGQGRDLPAVISGLEMDIQRVIVRDMSRLSRNALENYTVQSELEIDYGVLVEDVSARERNEVQEKLMKNIVKAVYENDTRERIKLRARMKGL